jgi:hypothetical protein
MQFSWSKKSSCCYFTEDRDGQQGFSSGKEGLSNPKVAFSLGLVYDGTQ